MNEYISKSNQNLVHYLSYQTYCVSFYHCIISALAKCLEALVLTMGPMASYLLKRLQSVINSAARLMFSSWRYEHITPLLCQLHWLKAAERIDYKLALLVYKCRQGLRSTAVPRRQTLPASRHRSSMSSVCIPPRHRH